MEKTQHLGQKIMATKAKSKNPSVVFFLAGALFEYHMKAAEMIRDKYPKAKLSAFVCARHNLHNHIKNLDGTKYAFNRYDFLNDMITKWVNTPVDYKKIEKYRKILGDDTLRKIITADREVGYGYVAGGFVERTPLVDFFEKNPDRRWSYVIGLLDYCFDSIKDQKPDVIYTYGVAGSDAIALHYAAQYHKIPAVQLSYTRMGDYYVVDPDEKMCLPDVGNLYKKVLKNPSLIDKDTMKKASNTIDEFRAKPERPGDTVFWINLLKKENSVFGYFKTAAKDAARWGAIWLGLLGSRGIWRQRYGSEIFKLSLSKFWHMQLEMRRKPQTLENLVGDAKFIYFPLQVDPEMTTMVMADKLTDQMAMIEFISKQMPAGWKLVVKDHVPMIGRRPSYFMKRVKQMPDVCVVSPFEDNFKCMKQASLTITLTGTAGWENMVLGKVPVILGNQHYLNLNEGFVACPEPTKIGEAIQKALITKPVSVKNLKLYTACVLSEAFELSTTYYWFKTELPEGELERSLDDFVTRLLGHCKL
jgi:hypothetical protein